MKCGQIFVSSEFSISIRWGGFAVSLTSWRPFLCSVLSPPLGPQPLRGPGVRSEAAPAQGKITGLPSGGSTPTRTLDHGDGGWSFGRTQSEVPWVGLAQVCFTSSPGDQGQLSGPGKSVFWQKNLKSTSASLRTC